jgi:hypothetical protein
MQVFQPRRGSVFAGLEEDRLNEFGDRVLIGGTRNLWGRFLRECLAFGVGFLCLLSMLTAVSFGSQSLSPLAGSSDSLAGRLLTPGQPSAVVHSANDQLASDIARELSSVPEVDEEVPAIDEPQDLVMKRSFDRSGFLYSPGLLSLPRHTIHPLRC